MRIADVILSRREQNNSLAGGLLNPVDGLLQCGGVVAATGGGDINRLGIFQSLRVKRSGPGWRCRGKTEQDGNQKQKLEFHRAVFFGLKSR